MATNQDTNAGQDSESGGEELSSDELEKVETERKRAAYQAEMAPWRERYDGRVEGFPCGKHGLLIVKYARGALYKNFKKRASELKDQNNHEGLLLLDIELVLNCTVSPADPKAAKELLEDYPTLVPTASMTIIRLSGLDVDPLGKA